MRGYDGFDPKTAIVGLDHALANITHTKARYIWNDLLPPIMRFLHGRYEEATHKNYDNATNHEVDSRRLQDAEEPCLDSSAKWGVQETCRVHTCRLGPAN